MFHPQSLGTEVTSIPEEFQVVEIVNPMSIVVDVVTAINVIDVQFTNVIDVSMFQNVIEVGFPAPQIIEVNTAPLSVPYVAPEVDMPLDVQVDEASPTVTYVGQAEPGTATSVPAWRIKRITDSGGQVTVDWALGVGSYVHVWDDRASLVYGP